MLNFIKKIKARRMNKIVEEVRQQLIEEMELHCTRVQGQLESFVIHKVNHMEVDYDEVVSHMDYSEVAYYADMSEVADYISVDDIAYNMDVSEIAQHIDADDIADRFDYHQLAQEVDIVDIADELCLDEKLEDLKCEVMNAAEDLIANTIDNLQIRRG